VPSLTWGNLLLNSRNYPRRFNRKIDVRHTEKVSPCPQAWRLFHYDPPARRGSGRVREINERLVVELAPAGALEEDIVLTIARLLWRKKNLASFRIAAQARKRFDAIVEETSLNDDFRRRRPKVEDLTQKEKAELEAMAQRVRQELGWKHEFLDMDKDDATVDRLLKELAVEERLDNLIERCLKRLLFLRGLKSVSASSSANTGASPKLIPQRKSAA
jgi:hypothetical protein